MNKPVTEADLDHMDKICNDTGVHKDGCSFSSVHAMRCEACHAENELAIHAKNWIPRLTAEIRRLSGETDPPDVDLDICPSCGGPADQGFDRCLPPSPYDCSKCDPPSCDICGHKGAEYYVTTGKTLCEQCHPNRKGP